MRSRLGKAGQNAVADRFHNRNLSFFGLPRHNTAALEALAQRNVELFYDRLLAAGEVFTFERVSSARLYSSKGAKGLSCTSFQSPRRTD